MALWVHDKPSFSKGEISKRLYDRTDLQTHDIAVARLENRVVLKQGGTTRRPTFFHVREAYAASRLVPFEYDRKDSYVIEVGDQVCRFYRDEGVLESSPGTIYEVALPYSAAQLPELRWTKSGDIIYLLHPKHTPNKLQRFGDVDWRVGTFEFLTGPFGAPNTDLSWTLDPSATSGTITLVSSQDLFVAGHVGALFRIAVDGIVQITAVTDARTASATVIADIPGAAATPIWTEGAFSDARGWPETANFHQARFWLAKGQFVHGSSVDDFEDFTIIPDDPSSAITERVGAGTQRVNDIEWLSSGKVQAIGTSGDEHSLQGAGGLNDGITATSLRIVARTTEGSRPIDPVRVGDSILHVSKDAARLQRFFFQFQADDFQSADLTVEAEHITKPGIKWMAWQRDPHNVLWIGLTDGRLRAVTYMPEQSVLGWHRHGPGGTIDDGVVIPRPDGVYDELWAIIRRQLPAGEKRYVERMGPYFDAEVHLNAADVVFLESQLKGSADPPANQITGLEHLEGLRVDVVGDGALISDESLVVLNGQIRLPAERTVSEFCVGLASFAWLRLLPTQEQFAEGTTKVLLRQVKGLSIRAVGAPGWLVGDIEDRDNMEYGQTWETGPMDTPPLLREGRFEVLVEDGWRVEDFVDVFVDTPFALDILGAPKIVEFSEL